MGIAAITAVIRDPSALLAMFGFVPSLIEYITIDVLVSESPVYSWDITRHPVEGGDVTDARVKQPIGLSLDCVFTDMQLSATNIISGLLKENFSLSTWRDKKDALYALADTNQRIDVRTPLDLYPNMMIREITPNQDKNTGGAFFFNIQFEKVITVASLWGNVDPRDLPIGNQTIAVEDLQKAKGA